jgi:hypothetical protein
MTRYQLYRGLGGPQGRSARVIKKRTDIKGRQRIIEEETKKSGGQQKERKMQDKCFVKFYTRGI